MNPYPFSMSCDIDMIYEQSNTMQAIEDKLDAIGDKIDGTNDKLDDTNDKLDDILKQPEQEKQEAVSAGDENVGALIDVIPNESQGFMNAVEGFASSMSYTGTSAVLSTPAVNFPQIGDLVPGLQIMPPMELDIEVYVEMMPESLLLLVRSLLTVALIVYCFKELYSTISYVLTLKGGGD